MGIFTLRALTQEIAHLRAMNTTLSETNMRLVCQVARLQEEVVTLGINASPQVPILRDALVEANKRAFAMNRENRYLAFAVMRLEDQNKSYRSRAVSKRPSLPVMTKSVKWELEGGPVRSAGKASNEPPRSVLAPNAGVSVVKKDQDGVLPARPLISKVWRDEEGCSRSTEALPRADRSTPQISHGTDKQNLSAAIANRKKVISKVKSDTNLKAATTCTALIGAKLDGSRQAADRFLTVSPASQVGADSRKPPSPRAIAAGRTASVLTARSANSVVFLIRSARMWTYERARLKYGVRLLESSSAMEKDRDGARLAQCRRSQVEIAESLFSSCQILVDCPGRKGKREARGRTVHPPRRAQYLLH